MPEVKFVALRLVKLEPSTAGSLVSLVICTNLLAVLKVLPWRVTLLERLASGSAPAPEGTEARPVKAAPETLLAVVIWANLVSTIAAEAEISALTMVESVI